MLLLLLQRKAKLNLSSKGKKKIKSHLLEATDLRGGGCHQVDQEAERSYQKNWDKPKVFYAVTYQFLHCG